MYFLPYSPAESPGPIEPTALTSSRPITPGARAKLPELLAILQNRDITHRWEKLSVTLIVDEIEDFSKETKKPDQTYHSGLLSDWADRLLNRLKTYNVAKIQETLAYFPVVIKEITALSENSN